MRTAKYSLMCAAFLCKIEIAEDPFFGNIAFIERGIAFSVLILGSLYLFIKFWMVIFPEGTRINKANLEKSKEFASSRGEYTLSVEIFRLFHFMSITNIYLDRSGNNL